MVVETPRDWPPSAAFLTAALDGLAQSPIVKPLTLATLDASIPAVASNGTPLVRQLGTQSDGARIPVASLRSAQRRLLSFSTVVGNDPRLLGEMGDLALGSGGSLERFGGAGQLADFDGLVAAAGVGELGFDFGLGLLDSVEGSIGGQMARWG